MYYFLAHKKLLSRMLDLGLFDELFAGTAFREHFALLCFVWSYVLLET